MVEFYGLPRERAGRPVLVVSAATARDALSQVVAHCPRLDPLLTADGRLDPHYLLSVNGERFLADLEEPLPAAARLLLLSADSGG